MVHSENTTGTEAGYTCISCGRFVPDTNVSWIPRQTPCVYDKTGRRMRDYARVVLTCPVCHGTGKVKGAICPECYGCGQVGRMGTMEEVAAFVKKWLETYGGRE
jgi:RecJ-like exonuclease